MPEHIDPLAWFDTEFAGPPLRKIVVVGSIDSLADGRVFEDAFAERLRAAGVDGVAGHTVIADAARASKRHSSRRWWAAGRKACCWSGCWAWKPGPR